MATVYESYQPEGKSPSLSSPIPRQTPPIIIPYGSYQNGRNREPGPLHQPKGTSPSSGSPVPEKTPSTANPYGKCQNGMDREPGPIHESVWKQPALGYCIERLRSLIVPPHSYQAPAVPIDFGSSHNWKRTQRGRKEH
ncbi:Hypothetical predicted protein [Podarcis lilfordi]|uniref:Uncharacterized protein n=1 Tax=Podarcis lilfordi TaxID=74358 RepID=A0AA35PD26_9SAUR|nr:Hypothetical predicted protein [Podarcis lilfordi]